VSKTILSDGVVMDSTPPVSEKFVHADENLAVNPSFENTAGSLVMWNDVNSTEFFHQHFRLLYSTYLPWL
jgi:hypothetical protein